MMANNGSGNCSSEGSSSIQNNVEFQLGAAYQLCFVVKNCAQNSVFHIGYKTPLQWLLELPRVRSKLCYCSIADITKCRLNLIDHNNDIDEVDTNVVRKQRQQNKTNSINFYAEDETIVICYC